MARTSSDPAHEETEKIIKQMEKRINQEYAQAEKELQEKLDDYMRRYHTKDKKWREWVADGTKTKDEYQRWKVGQLAVGKRWESMKQTIAEDMYHSEQIAKSIVKGYLADIYALNFNYGTYEAEVGAHINTGFTLYNREAVERIMRDNPNLLPKPGRKVSKAIAEGKAVRWNKQVVQSVMIQGILQGESIPKLATRLADAVGETNRKAAIRNARTMATGAQNASREDAYKRAVDKGVDMMQEWRATLDMRTRHEHRQLDGQLRPVGEPFEVDGEKIEYPGDLSAPGYLVYNCRCTLLGRVKGLEPRARQYRDDSMIEGMSYEEWKAQRTSQSNPITLPEDKGNAIAESYRREYRNGSHSGANDMLYGSKDVYYDSNADYSIVIDGYSNKLNSGISRAANDVAKEGSKYRYEYSAIVDALSGEVVDFGTDKEKTSVSYYYKYLREHLDGKYILVHNHNTESTLSLPDIQELSMWENLDGYCAVSNNGIISYVKTNGIKSNEYLWLKYEDEVKRLKEAGYKGAELEQEVVKIAINDFCDGGMIIYDGRSK